MKAAASGGIPKRISSHALRHRFAAHLLEGVIDSRSAEELLGHADVSTTMIDLHVLRRPGAGAPTPPGPQVNPPNGTPCPP